jgi:hypothetical protein
VSTARTRRVQPGLYRVSLEMFLPEAKQLAGDLKRLLGLIDHLAAMRQVPGLDKPDQEAYDRVARMQKVLVARK